MITRFLATFAVLATSCAVAPDTTTTPTEAIRVTDRRVVMGVEATITTWAPTEAAAREASRAAFTRMAALEQAISDYRPRSESMLAVETVGEPVAISPEFALALARSQVWHDRSGGAFDPTIGPVTALWRNARKAGGTPTDRAVAFARTTVGWTKLDFDESASTVTFRTAAMGLDFGGIGKGLAADLALQVMREHGLPRTLVEVGGDLVAGSPPPGRPGWMVRVRTVPWDDGVEFVLADAAAATSGDVEQFVEVEIDGEVVRHGHLLDPRSGRTIARRRQATAVVRGGRFNGADADALATVGVVLGLRDSARVADGTLDAELRIVEARRPNADGGVADDWRVDALRFGADPAWAGPIETTVAGDGFAFTEGPVVRSDGSVWFTDQPNDRIVRWTDEAGCEVVIEPALRSNGLAIDAAGRLLACAEAGNELVRFVADGTSEVLARADGAGFNGPNDLWVGPEGAIWFTDPWYPRPWHAEDDWRRPAAVHRLDPDGTVAEVAGDFGRPNGIVGTPDGRTLFVADIDRGRLWSYPIAAAGLGPRRLVVPLGSDGMAWSPGGRLLLTGRGVFVVDPDRSVLVRTLVPDEPWCANVAIGPDGSIWVTARDRLLRLTR